MRNLYPPGYSKPFSDAIDENDIVTDAAVVDQADAWQEVGRYTVPAGHFIELGLGSLEGHDSAVGRLFIEIMDVAPAQITGRYRLVAFNTTETSSRIIFSLPWQRTTSGAAAAITGQRVFAASDVLVKENEILVLQVRPDDAGQGPVVADNCTVIIDVTRGQYDPARA